MSGRFRVTVWDPVLIISQIVCIQACFYFSFGGLLILAALGLDVNATLFNVFSHKAINFSDRAGVATVICYVVNAIAGSIGLWMVVKRTKQCLDFSVTCYLIHLLLSSLYNGAFPWSIAWWLLTIAGVTIMCVCGEFLCLKTELDDIPLLGSRVEL